MKVAWFFPGQGSQHKGMGRDLFEDFPDVVALADEILGRSIVELCCNDPDKVLNHTQFAQPALYVCSALELRKRLQTERAPDFVAGHSLGEFTALLAASVFDFETGLRIVSRRGELMAAASGGSMAAILGLDERQVADLLAEHELPGLEIANVNSPTQVVVSGAANDISQLVQRLRATKLARAVPLAVSAAFHSSQMADAAQNFAVELAGYDLKPPAIPVMANATGLAYPNDDPTPTLSLQLRSKVRWWDIMMELRSAAVESAFQVGPGDVLTNLWAEAMRVSPPQPTSQFPPVEVVRVRPRSGSSVGVSDRGSAPVEVVRVRPRSGSTADGFSRRLGSGDFCRRHGVREAYMAGSMYMAIASVDLVAGMAESGLLSFYGTGGKSAIEIERALDELQDHLPSDAPYGFNLLAGPKDREQRLVDLFVQRGVRVVEASSYIRLTAPLVEFRFRGARIEGGRARALRNVVAKVSRLELAEAFLSPPPSSLLDSLLESGRLSVDEVAAAKRLPVAADVCIEADSGGHTDSGAALALLPTAARLKSTVDRATALDEPICVGVGGGIGCPEAVAAAFSMGADFVTTGSINQCSREAGMAPVVKDLLATLSVHDTAIAPAGDLFESGARVQVVRKSTLFAPRANHLYQLYRNVETADLLDGETRSKVETYLGMSLAEAKDGVLASVGPAQADSLASNQRRLFAEVLKLYFKISLNAALIGDLNNKVNFQIHSGPAIGAFNAFVKGTSMEDWRNRRVDDMADELMTRAKKIVGLRQ